VERRQKRIAWDELDCDQWLKEMDRLMAKPTTRPRKVGRSDFLKTTKLSRIQTQEVVQFFDPLPAEVKRESAAAFRAYLERKRRERRKASRTKKKTSALRAR